MPEPMVVTIPHQLGKTEARRRLDEGLGRVRQQVASFASDVEQRWEGDRLVFRLAAAGQSVTGRIDVMETDVRVEVDLPWMLAMLARKLTGQIQQTGAKLLTKA